MNGYPGVKIHVGPKKKKECGAGDFNQKIRKK
jgi:hypothetical protein